MRKNAHGGVDTEETFSILDDLESMRRLSDGMIELKCFIEVLIYAEDDLKKFLKKL